MLDSVMKELLSKHPELFSDVINAMLKTDEKYTSYFDATTYEEYFSDVEYYGIGVLVEIKDDYITISAVYEGPAKEAGIQIGDRLIAVEGQDVTYSTIEYVGTLIRGISGTSVNITVQRPSTDKTLHFSIKRGAVSTSPISYEVLQDDIGYIKIKDFNGLQAWLDFCDAEEKLMKWV